MHSLKNRNSNQKIQYLMNIRVVNQSVRIFTWSPNKYTNIIQMEYYFL